MRKINTVISALLLGLFVFHAVAGGYQLMGVLPGGSTLMEALAWLMLLLVAAHLLLGVVFTAETVRAIRRAGVHYWKENIAFWLRRLSGLALLMLLALHLILFVQTGEGIFRLADFDVPQLIGQLLLVLSLALHLICNIRPLAVALGLYGGHGYLRDVLLVFAVVLVFCGAAFVIYYLRWNVWWR